MMYTPLDLIVITTPTVILYGYFTKIKSLCSYTRLYLHSSIYYAYIILYLVYSRSKIIVFILFKILLKNLYDADYCFKNADFDGKYYNIICAMLWWIAVMFILCVLICTYLYNIGKRRAYHVSIVHLLSYRIV